MESAAMRYREIVGLAARASDELRAWERGRVQELDGQIAAAEADVAQAREREERTKQTVRNWWRMTADNVSRLPWVEIGDEPGPAPNAHGSWLDRYLNEIKPRYQELVDAVLSLGWRARR
jgi:hypothetical protein